MFIRTLFFALWLITSIGVHAQPMLLKDLAVLADPKGELTINEVAGSQGAAFRPLPTGSFAGGFTRSVFWFRFSVAQAGETWLDIQPPVLDDLRLFEADPHQSNAWLERRAGDTLPFATREVPYRGFVFKLRHRDAKPQTYYLRLTSTSTIVLSPRLMTPDDFIATTTLESSLLMASVVLVLVVVLLNANAWFWLRDPLTPWFIANLLATVGHLLGSSGFLQQYFSPTLPAMSFYWVGVFSFALIGTGNGFYRRLFGIGPDRKYLYWLYEANCWLPLAALPLALMGWQTEVLPVFLNASILMTGVGFVMAFGLWRRGAVGSGAMLLANLISMVGILVFVLHALGVVAGGFFTWHSLQIASLGSVFALHLALGARSRSLSDDRVKAEHEAKHEHAERVRQSQFLAMLAHELRTSLTVLRMAVGNQPMSPKTVAKAERAMNSMVDVIDQSVQVERLADGKVTIELLPCDIVCLVEAAIADSRDPPRVDQKLAQKLSLNTDGRLLRIVVSNLIDNALKYGKVGERIDVELRAEGEHLRLIVANPIGTAGVPDPERVFEKYYRAPLAHEFSGSGLGLHISQALARLMGGELAYTQAQGRVMFELRL